MMIENKYIGIYLNPSENLLFLVTKEPDRLVQESSKKEYYVQTLASNWHEKYSYIDLNLKGKSFDQISIFLNMCFKVKLHDLPLYIGWPYKTEKFSTFLKGESWKLIAEENQKIDEYNK